MSTQINEKPDLKDEYYCSIDYWYPIFKKHSIKTVILPLEEEFIQYLSSGIKLSRLNHIFAIDGVQLPKMIQMNPLDPRHEKAIVEECNEKNEESEQVADVYEFLIQRGEYEIE